MFISFRSLEAIIQQSVDHLGTCFPCAFCFFILPDTGFPTLVCSLSASPEAHACIDVPSGNRGLISFSTPDFTSSLPQEYTAASTCKQHSPNEGYRQHRDNGCIHSSEAGS